MILLDLFCGAGGAAMGYHRAGFDRIIGVDNKPQKNYPFEFVLADAMTFPLEGFDLIHASPPCQKFSALKAMWNAGDHDDLLTPTLDRLEAQPTPFVVENVAKAPMRAAVKMCGSAFGLTAYVEGRGIVELRRHRLFETNWPILVPPCMHQRGRMVLGFYGDHARIRRRSITGKAEKLRLVKEAMEIDWMSWSEANQAIPPAYTEYIGRAALEAVR